MMKTINFTRLHVSALWYFLLWKWRQQRQNRHRTWFPVRNQTFYMTASFPSICLSSRIYFSSLYSNWSADSNEINTALCKQNCGCKNSHIIVSAKNTLLAGVWVSSDNSGEGLALWKLKFNFQPSLTVPVIFSQARATWFCFLLLFFIIQECFLTIIYLLM